MKLGGTIISLLVLLSSITCFQLQICLANENVVGRPRASATITEADKSSAGVQQDRTFSDPSKLTATVRKSLSIKAQSTSALPPVPHDGKSHPFTTKNASAKDGISPVDKYPWSAVGKMFMKFGQKTFVCTASVIGKNILVTAAHCVHNYGKTDAGFTDSVMFEPARHGDEKPFGTWVGREWWIPKAYFDGKDICSKEAKGIVCENDIAVVVLEKNDNNFIAEKTGQFGFKTDEYGYGTLFDKKVTQITQLGYPSHNYDGLTMIRTDSLGYQDTPSNVIIGSAQTGGSSGGPWLQNFGMKTSYTGTTPLADDDNQVVATTSWGYTSGNVMIQGASRFRRNSIYTIKSNIESLVDSACSANPGVC